MESEDLIKIADLFSGYGKKEILHGITLSIKKAQVTTIIGRNGVGKTTLLKTMIGLLSPRAGYIYYEGKDILGIRSDALIRRGISYVPQGKSIFPHMTVEEHIEIGAWVLRNERDKKITKDRVYSLFPRLLERKLQKGGTLSGGERQMLSIGRALMSLPKLLLLDEPSFGLAPKMIEGVFETIGQINREGVTICLVEQNAKKALNFSNYGYVMDMGRIKLEGKSKYLFENEEIKAVYLGGGVRKEVGSPK